MAAALPPELPSNHPHELMKKMAWLPDEIRQLLYFHHYIKDSDQATKLVKQQGSKAGSFLLRLSSKGENFLALSVSIGNQHVHHIKIVVCKRPRLSYYVVPEMPFQSFRELQEYYSVHRIGNLEKIDNVKLLYPINRRERTASLPESVNIDLLNRRNKFASNRQISQPNLQKTTLNGSNSSMNSQGSSNRSSGNSHVSFARNSGASISEDQVGFRPPLPLPPRPTGDLDPYYSRPKDENQDRVHELKEYLKNSEKCDCGLLLSHADLGGGWAVHKSRESLTFGRLFYQNQNGQTTWSLPENIICKLTPPKIDYLRHLYEENGQAVPFDDTRCKQLNVAMMY
ncbi:uncharacterized protein LOC126828195 [Patella vulgata]|uniref:uncharacterized protein LOC126828195 n=1 Tax=Patella vulgata TaxID=6465 RepID=UPI00218053F5|nr:uncharacterized protein LOC126828195 [Patella vulgata]XP_050413772.1 uncharacterized protein LOC126828195 [Patella vulgata]